MKCFIIFQQNQTICNIWHKEQSKTLSSLVFEFDIKLSAAETDHEYWFAEEVILAEERTTEEEKMHIIEGKKSTCTLLYYYA